MEKKDNTNYHFRTTGNNWNCSFFFFFLINPGLLNLLQRLHWLLSFAGQIQCGKQGDLSGARTEGPEPMVPRVTSP